MLTYKLWQHSVAGTFTSRIVMIADTEDYHKNKRKIAYGKYMQYKRIITGASKVPAL